MPIPAVFEHMVERAGIKLVGSREIYPALHQPGDAGQSMLVVKNALGRAIIGLQGAQVMSFQPSGAQEMLWVSPKCVLEPGKAVRGGIPLCIPWFGPGQEGAMLHGFGRIMEWSLVAVEICCDGATRLALELAGDALVCKVWPYAFRFRLEVTVGTTLTLALSADNRSTADAPFAFAFHTYFAVPNVSDVLVTGLMRTTFIDKLDNMTRKVQQGDIAIQAPTERVYLDVPAEQLLKIPTGDVKIKSDAKCAVVWNAYTNDRNLPDLGEGNHVGYICVERGDVADHAVRIQGGDRYQVSMSLSSVSK